ncbi:hypothetical protein [Syntrophotalea acetylenica]|uniref:Uncharacterized protein n=1 Tax=Syntrophotalea acetylenica TaxID=29542 RepID=A0A1L3GDF7_SYNAC|nr:hypothetical protein [Syntrophotalea acetylenica]APG23984.1 hypothetical protein A7E75_02315 [Syntrophotalea acetylenica]
MNESPRQPPGNASSPGPDLSLPLPPPRAGRGPVRLFFLIALVSLSVSIGSVWAYDRYFAQKVVAVDIQGFLDIQKQEFLRGAIDERELERRMDRLEKVVDTIPSRYAVLMGDVVIRHVEVIKP